MNWKAYLAIAFMAAVCAAGGWAVGRSIDAPAEVIPVRPGAAASAYVIGSMEREFLLSLDQGQRQTYLDTLADTAHLRAVAEFFQANPIRPRNDVFELIDADNDGLIDRSEFDRAAQFVWVVHLDSAPPPPERGRSAADIDLLLYLDDLRQLDDLLNAPADTRAEDTP